MRKSFIVFMLSLLFLGAVDFTRQDGYTDGYRDGQNALSKSGAAKLKKDTDSKEYNDGYAKGFEEGVRDGAMAQTNQSMKCDVPGYLRTENCKRKDVLFSWRVMFSSAVSTYNDDYLKAAFVNLGFSTQFGAYYRILDNLLLGGNAGIGIGGLGLSALAMNFYGTQPIITAIERNIYIPIEAVVKYYFNFASFAVGLGIGGDISFSKHHTFRTFAEFGWPGFSLRLGWQHQSGIIGQTPLSETFYSALVFGY